jgi:hypothetical protein
MTDHEYGRFGSLRERANARPSQIVTTGADDYAVDLSTARGFIAQRLATAPSSNAVPAAFRA